MKNQQQEPKWLKSPLEKSAESLGMTPEQLRELQNKARAEVDSNDDWRKKLDAQNKAKSGIKIDNEVILRKRKTPKFPYEALDTQNYVISKNKMYRVYFEYSHLYVVDRNANYKFEKTIPMYCHVCGISETGKYAAFQTANGFGESANIPATFLLYDLSNADLIFSKHLETGWKDMCSIELLENEEIVRIHYAEDFVDYYFNGEPVDLQQIENYIFKYSNAYELEAYTDNLIKSCNGNIDDQLHKKLLFILDEINGCLYPNRLSKLYKSIGEIYECMSNNNIEGATENAVFFYEKGLSLNPALSVKRALKKLKQQNI